jgi:hypothetical protein
MPGHPTRARFALAAALVLAGFAGAALFAPSHQVLVVERLETGEPVLERAVDNGTTVRLAYTHSVEKSRVEDGYTVQGDHLVQTRMAFESYGWGLPAQANVTREDGMFVYDPPGTYESLAVAPGRIADHRLVVDDRTYDLVARADGEAVRLRLERRPMLGVLA